jgi:heptosyltransferase III
MKSVEGFFRHAFAWLMGLLFWRPGRKARAAKLLAEARRVFLVRIDDRVGEALLTTPLFDALKGRFEVHVLVHPKCARVLDAHPSVTRVIPFARNQLWWGLLSAQVRALRAQTRGQVVINCASWREFSGVPALVARLLAPHAALVAPNVGANTLLADVCVAARGDTQSETKQRVHLLSPLGIVNPPALPSFRTPRDPAAVEPLLQQLGGKRYAVVNPGGRLDWRRVPPEVFGAIASGLKERGIEPVITWGPGEEPLARQVVAASNAMLAPPTSLDALATLMRGSTLTICNNTGPMHLSVAVGAPTVGLFLHMPMERWGHFAPPHRMMDLTPMAGQLTEAATLKRIVAEVLGRDAGG